MAEPEAYTQPNAEQPAAETQPPAAPKDETPTPRPRPGQRPAGPPLGQREPPKPYAEALAAMLREAWDSIAYEQQYNFGDLEVSMAAADLLEACRRCKEDSRLAFDYLMSITGVDYEQHFEVVYHLYSYAHHHRLTIKARIDDYEHPSVASVMGLWPGADWHEREAAEMLGIDFPGHHNLVPLLLEEDVEELPLRRSHPLVPVYFDRPGLVQRPEEG